MTQALGITDIVNIQGGVLNSTPVVTGLATQGFAPPVSIGFHTKGLYPGMVISGTGIPAGTKILTIDSGSQITMTASATVSATETLTFKTYNDIYLNDSGNLTLVTDRTAVLQACEEAARALRGSMVLDTARGIPYDDTVWAGVPNIRQFEIALRNAFLAVDGVTSVVSLATNQEGSTLTYSAVIQTIYGGGAVSG